MTANRGSPNWPAWAHDSHWAWRLNNARLLEVVTQRYLDEGRLRSVRVIDADLKLFKVTDVATIGPAGILGWRPGYKGKYVKVRPSFELEKSFSLEGAKTYIMHFLDAHPRVYESGTVRTAIEAATSPDELFKLL